MKNFLIFFSICAVFVLTQNSFGQNNWKIYHNARFEFRVGYPADLLSPQGEADNGDGQIFTNESAEMRVFGSRLLLNETLKKEFLAIGKQHDKVSYKLLRKNFFVVSGLNENGRIFYQKTIAKPNGTFLTFYLEYDKAKRADYDKILTRILTSFG